MLKIVQKLKKRIKLLTIDENLVSVVLDMNTEYKKNDFQKKPWKAFDNIHHQLNVIEKSYIEDKKYTHNYNDRVVNMILKLHNLLYNDKQVC